MLLGAYISTDRFPRVFVKGKGGRGFR